MFEKVIINVGGQTFVTKRSTLQRYPDTKLANISETCEHFDITTEVYYFDRNPLIFQSVLDYYRTGKLHFLSNICVEQIRDELQFWEISTSDLGPCCWKYFYTVDSDLKTCNVIDKHFFQRQCFLYSSKSSLTNVKSKILNVLENPRSSTFALVWQLFYLSVVCLAIIVSVIQSFELTRGNMKEIRNVTSEEDVKERLTDHDNWIGVVTHESGARSVELMSTGAEVNWRTCINIATGHELITMALIDLTFNKYNLIEKDTNRL
ncbi:KCNC1 [Mytilus edulis]|uniref:KCNC1 n=1 Tax=Mytilus edulis TaxID=6550 RepID=A0A8S3QES1_MYTED|nr:KCNC1 [Mytilus edulis]